MIEEKVTLCNEVGLHARPASIFIREAVKYSSKVEVRKGDKTYNAKSIMAVLSMGAVKGDELTIIASGDDEKEAVKNICRVVGEGLGEQLH